MKKIKVIIFIAALIIGIGFAKVFGFSVGFGLPKFSFFSHIQGSGNAQTEKRNVADFKQIDVSGALDVEVNSQNEFGVNVEADDNLLQYVKTEVSGDTLKIYISERVSRNSKIRITVSMPELTGADISGASRVIANSIKTDSFNLDVSGASKIELNGEANDLKIESSGASKINAENLMVANANVDVSGASQITVNAAEEVRAEASGASKVFYVGEPKNVIKDVSGASKISQK